MELGPSLHPSTEQNCQSFIPLKGVLGHMYCMSIIGEGCQLFILQEDEKGPEDIMSTNKCIHVFSPLKNGMMLDICIFLIENARLEM